MKKTDLNLSHYCENTKENKNTSDDLCSYQHKQDSNRECLYVGAHHTLERRKVEKQYHYNYKWNLWIWNPNL